MYLIKILSIKYTSLLNNRIQIEIKISSLDSLIKIDISDDKTLRVAFGNIKCCLHVSSANENGLK